MVKTLTIAEVIERRMIVPVFQPLIWLSTGKIYGYTASIQGPPGTLLCSPRRLFHSARSEGCLLELVNHGLETVVQQFVEAKLQGVLFLHLDLDVFSVVQKIKDVQIEKAIQQNGMDPARIALYLSGLVSGLEHGEELLRKLTGRYGERGFAVAVDDVAAVLDGGEDQPAHLPDFVFLDRHLIGDIDKEPVKFKLLKALLKRVRQSSCRLIATGIGTRSELLLLKDADIPLGMGHFVARAAKNPARVISREVQDVLAHEEKKQSAEFSRVEALIERLPSFQLDDCNEDVFQLFEKNPQVSVVAVTNNGLPIGLISRSVFINRYARPYQRELYGKKPCTTFMDPEPLIVDRNISIQELSRLLAEDQRHISTGFIFTENGSYLGIGTSQNLIHEITEMQIQAARYANPLTGLPGNARIDEEVNTLLRSQETFCVAYFDLDNFKPFNDVYGFSMGDAVIQMLARIITGLCDAERDFVGHIGGDDFIVLFRSADWERRCKAMLDRFAVESRTFFSAEDLERGGYIAENRRGEKEFHALVSVSIGAVVVKPRTFRSHKEIAVVASESKKMAKKTRGNSLYVNQRHYPEIEE